MSLDFDVEIPVLDYPLVALENRLVDALLPKSDVVSGEFGCFVLCHICATFRMVHMGLQGTSLNYLVLFIIGRQ